MLWPHSWLQTLRKNKNKIHASFHPAQAGAGCVLQSNIFFVLKNGRDVLRGSAEVLLELREMNPQLGLLHFLPARGADGVPVSWRDLRRRARRAHISFAQISSSRFFFSLYAFPSTVWLISTSIQMACGSIKIPKPSCGLSGRSEDRNEFSEREASKSKCSTILNHTSDDTCPQLGSIRLPLTVH